MRDTKYSGIRRLTFGVAVLALAAFLGASLGTAGAISPKVKISVLSNDYPEEAGEPDQLFTGRVHDAIGGWLHFEGVLSHEGEPIPIPEELKALAKSYKQEVWLDFEVTCVNFFDEGDGRVAAVVAAHVTDSGWIDPAIFGGFPQFLRDSWQVVKFVDGGPDGDGDSFRIGQGDLDQSLQPPAPPFTEERAVQVCESGDVPADGTGDELCYGPGAVVIDGVSYGPWVDEDGEPMDVCESWRTTHKEYVAGTGDGLLVDGDISIR